MTILEVPAAPAQHRLWAVVQEAPDEAIYQVGVDIVNEGPLDLAALEAALRDLIWRHEALRTEFHLVDGVLYQRVQEPPERAPLDFIELRGQSLAEVNAAYLRTRADLITTMIELEHSPLVRVTVVRRPGRDEALDRPYDTIVFVAHHIIVDAWSAEIFTTELQAAYQAHRAGKDPGFEPVAVQCADFCAWQADQADDAQRRRDLAFWRENLADLPDLDLTHGKPRAATPSHRGGRFEIEIEPDLTEDLRRFARERRCTPFMVLYAAFSVALGRVFGGTDIAVGTNISIRKLPEMAETIGMFVDRVVLRLDVGGHQAFRDLVSRARDVVLAAHDHLAPGFEQIVSAVAPRRALGVTPLAQVSFNLQPALSGRNQELYRQVMQARDEPGADQEFPLHPVDGNQFYGTVLHDLGLDLRDRPSRFTGILEYREGVVTQADARRVLSLTRRVLRTGMAEPARPLATIATLEPDELALVLAAHDGGPPRATKAHLLDLVGSWVSVTPHALAVDARDGRLTYRELGVRANALAARLRTLGVTAEQPVLVAVGRGAALPVALLGVLAAGGVYVPVDPLAPAAYLADVAATSGARVAVTEPGARPALPASVTAVALGSHDGSAADAGAQAGLARPDGIDSASAAYLLFTSGSTGHPKGVTVEHRNLTAYLAGVATVIDPAPAAVHLLVQDPTFDASLTTICGALASGGVLRIADADAAVDPGLLAAAVSGSPVDYLKLTPSHLGALLAGQDELTLRALRPRKAVILGGEAVPDAFTSRLRAAGWNVINQYGPTETTIGVLVGPGDGETGHGSAWLGKPLPGVRVYVLDEDGSQVPPGCLGELCVAGELVARGYAAAPAATAAAFCPDPYAPVPGARMYRTGDLVRARGDGTFTFCGRRDRQVKVRGHRVEPAAIEAVLAGQPGVDQAAVVARGERDDPRLVGYLVTAGLDMPALQAALATRLPEYARPSALVIVDSLPLTRSGKLDEAALPDPGRAALAGTDDPADAEPATVIETRLAQIWRGVLRRDTVSVTADFFDLGGDSIRAVQAVAEARAQGIKLTTRGLMRHRTIRALARTLPPQAGEGSQAVDAGIRGWAGVTCVHVPRGPGADDLPALLAPYTGPGSGMVSLIPRERHIEVSADAGSCDDYTLGALATALAEPGAPLPPLAPDGTARGDPALPAPQTTEVTEVTIRSYRGVRGVVPLEQQSTPHLAHAVLPAAVHDGLRGRAHDAYGTEPSDLAVAAVARALRSLGQPDPGRLLLTDVTPGAGTGRNAGQRSRAACLDLTVGADLGALAQAAKAAVRTARAGQTGSPGGAGGRPPTATVRVLDLPAGVRLAAARMPTDRCVVFVAGASVLVATVAGLDAQRLTEAVCEALAEIVQHCMAQAPVYSLTDFPTANLSQAELERLLASVNSHDDGASR